MDKAVTRANVEEIVGKAVDKAVKEISAVIHDFSNQVAARFDKMDERFDRMDQRMDHFEAEQKEIKQSVIALDQCVSVIETKIAHLDAEIRYINHALAEMKEELRLTRGEQQALRNDILDFSKALQALEKRVHRFEIVSQEAYRKTEAEIRHLQKWAIEIGARANVPFALASAES